MFLSIILIHHSIDTHNYAMSGTTCIVVMEYNRQKSWWIFGITLDMVISNILNVFKFLFIFKKI